MLSLQEQAQQFEAVEAQYGDPVLYYLDGDSHLEPYVGNIVKVDGRVVDIITFDHTGHRYWQEVRHISDPILKINEHIKRHGGWQLNPRFAHAADVHLVVRACEDRFDTMLAELDRKITHIYEQLDVKPPAAPVVSEPQVVQSQQESPADIGLTKTQFGLEQGKVIEGGVVKERVTAEEIAAAVGEAKPMRINVLCETLNASKDQVMDIVSTDPRFSYTDPGWVRFKNKETP